MFKAERKLFMTLEPFLMIIAPLFIFVAGVLFIPYIMRSKKITSVNKYKLIDELEKKYIY